MVRIEDNTDRGRQRQSPGFSFASDTLTAGMNLLEELAGAQEITSPAIRNLQGYVQQGGMTSQQQYWDPNLIEKMEQSGQGIAEGVLDFVRSGFSFAKEVGENIVLKQEGYQNLDVNRIEEGISEGTDNQEIWAERRAEDILKIRDLNLGPNVTATQVQDWLSGKDTDIPASVAKQINAQLGFSPSSSTWPIHWSTKKQLDWYDEHFGNIESTMESRKGPVALLKSRNKFVLDAIGKNLTKNSFKSLFSITLEKLSQVPGVTDEDYNEVTKALLNQAYEHNPTWANDGTFVQGIQEWADRRLLMTQSIEMKAVDTYIRELTSKVEGGQSILDSVQQTTIEDYRNNLEKARLIGLIPQDATSFDASFDPKVLAEVISNQMVNLLGENVLPVTEDYSSLGKDVSLTELFKGRIKSSLLYPLHQMSQGNKDANVASQMKITGDLARSSMERGDLPAVRKNYEDLITAQRSINTPQGRTLVRSSILEPILKDVQQSGPVIHRHIQSHSESLGLPTSIDQLNYALDTAIPERAEIIANLLTEWQLGFNIASTDDTRVNAIFEDNYNKVHEIMEESYRTHALGELTREMEGASTVAVNEYLRQYPGGLNTMVDATGSPYTETSLLNEVYVDINLPDNLTTIFRLLPEGSTPTEHTIATPNWGKRENEMRRQTGGLMGVPKETVISIDPTRTRLVSPRELRALPEHAGRIKQMMEQGVLGDELVWEMIETRPDGTGGKVYYKPVEAGHPAMVMYDKLIESIRRPIFNAWEAGKGGARKRSTGNTPDSLEMDQASIDLWRNAAINIPLLSQDPNQALPAQQAKQIYATGRAEQINTIRTSTSGKRKYESSLMKDNAQNWSETLGDSDSQSLLFQWIGDVFVALPMQDQESITTYLISYGDERQQIFGNFLENYLEEAYPISKGPNGRQFRERDITISDPMEVMAKIYDDAKSSVENMLTPEAYDALWADYTTKEGDITSKSSREQKDSLMRSQGADMLADMIWDQMISDRTIASLSDDNKLTAERIAKTEISFDLFMTLLDPDDRIRIMEEFIVPAVNSTMAPMISMMEAGKTESVDMFTADTGSDFAELGITSLKPNFGPMQVKFNELAARYTIEPVLRNGNTGLQLVERIGSNTSPINERFMSATDQTNVKTGVRVIPSEELNIGLQLDMPTGEPSYLARLITQQAERSDEREDLFEDMLETGSIDFRHYARPNQEYPRSLTNPDILQADQENFDAIIQQGKDDPDFDVRTALQEQGYPHDLIPKDEDFPEWLERMSLRTSLYPDEFTTELQSKPELGAIAERVDSLATEYQWIRPYLPNDKAEKQDNNFRMAYTLSQILASDDVALIKPEQQKEMKRILDQVRQAIRTRREPGIAEPLTPEEETAIQKAEESLDRIDTYITQSHEERAWYNANIQVGNEITGLEKIWQLSKAVAEEWHPSYDTMTVTNQGQRVQYHWAKEWENVDFIEAKAYDQTMHELNRVLEAIDISRQTREFEAPRHLMDNLRAYVGQIMIDNRAEIQGYLDTELSLLSNTIEKNKAKIGTPAGKAALGNLPPERQRLIFDQAMDSKQGTISSSPPPFAQPQESRVPIVQTLSHIRRASVASNDYGPYNNAWKNVYDDIDLQFEAMRITDPEILISTVDPDGNPTDPTGILNFWFTNPTAIEFYQTWKNNPDNPSRAIRDAGLDIRMEKLFEEQVVLGAFQLSGEWEQINFDSLLPQTLRRKLFSSPLGIGMDYIEQKIQDAYYAKEHGPYSPYNIYRSDSISTDYTYADAVRDYVTHTEAIPDQKFWEFIAEQERHRDPLTQMDILEFAVSRTKWGIPLGRSGYDQTYEEAIPWTFGGGQVTFAPMTQNEMHNRHTGYFRNKPQSGDWVSAFDGIAGRLMINGRSMEELTGVDLVYKKDIRWNDTLGRYEIYSLHIPALLLNDSQANPNSVPRIPKPEPEEYAGENLTFYLNKGGPDAMGGRFDKDRSIQIAVPENSAIQAQLKRKQDVKLFTKPNLISDQTIRLSENTSQMFNVAGLRRKTGSGGHFVYSLIWDPLNLTYNLQIQEQYMEQSFGPGLPIDLGWRDTGPAYTFRLAIQENR